MAVIGRSLLMLALLAMALITGFFYAYGSSVLPGLDALAAGDAVRAMQAINARVRNPMFAPSFFGALALPILALVVLATARRWRTSGWLALSLLAYGVGGFLVTTTFNVPLNQGLASVDPGAPDIARIARTYFTSWNYWNWARTFASLAAVACISMAWRVEARNSVLG